MSNSRKNYSSKLKAEVAIQAIREKISESKLVSEHGIHSTQIKVWKHEGLKAIQRYFSKHYERKDKENEKLLADLYQEIGQLQIQVKWLKKKSDGLHRGEKNYD